MPPLYFLDAELTLYKENWTELLFSDNINKNTLKKILSENVEKRAEERHKMLKTDRGGHCKCCPPKHQQLNW